jgi:hypothetical protein
MEYNGILLQRGNAMSETYDQALTRARPWDQWPNEPAGAYKRFVVFRELGPGRSLNRAYQEFLRLSGVTKGVEGRRAPGCWQRYAEEWSWAERCHGFDIASFAARGQKVVVLYLECILEATRKLLRGIQNGRGPVTEAEINDALETLARLIPPEAVYGTLLNASGRGATIPS